MGSHNFVFFSLDFEKQPFSFSDEGKMHPWARQIHKDLTLTKEIESATDFWECFNFHIAVLLHEGNDKEVYLFDVQVNLPPLRIEFSHVKPNFLVDIATIEEGDEVEIEWALQEDCLVKLSLLNNAEVMGPG